MAIADYCGTKKEWKTIHLYGFLKAKCHHKERPILPTIYKRGLGYGGNTWDVLCFKWIFRSKHVKRNKCDRSSFAWEGQINVLSNTWWMLGGLIKWTKMDRMQMKNSNFDSQSPWAHANETLVLRLPRSFTLMTYLFFKLTLQKI